jgi:hypothetical protein
MGFWTSAYLAYGIEIPHTDTDTLDEKLHGNTTGISYLNAGDYDVDKTFLVTACYDAVLGKPAAANISEHYADGNPEGRWNQMLDHAVGVIGVEVDGEPGWLLIADVS